MVMEMEKKKYIITKNSYMQTKQLLLGVMWFTIGHLFVFFQLNGQFFKMDWFRKHEMGCSFIWVYYIIFLYLGN